MHYEGTHAILLSALAGAAQLGDFTLSSGATSNLYVDARLVTMNPAYMPLIGQLICYYARGFGVTAIGGPATAACPMVASVGAQSTLQDRLLLKLFYARSETKQYGARRTIEGCSLYALDRILLVDDVVTSGNSLLSLAKHIREHVGARVEHAFCLLEREEGGREALSKAGITLTSLVQKSELLSLMI